MPPGDIADDSFAKLFGPLEGQPLGHLPINDHLGMSRTTIIACLIVGPKHCSQGGCIVSIACDPPHSVGQRRPVMPSNAISAEKSRISENLRHVDVVRFLLQSGHSDVDSDSAGSLPLHEAAWGGHQEVLEP